MPSDLIYGIHSNLTFVLLFSLRSGRVTVKTIVINLNFEINGLIFKGLYNSSSWTKNLI